MSVQTCLDPLIVGSDLTAEQMCARCTARPWCLPPTPTDGVTLARCGTISAYRRHVRRDEPACEACRLAENAYRRARRGVR